MMKVRERMQSLLFWGMMYDDYVIPLGALIIVVCLLAAAYIHWRFK